MKASVKTTRSVSRTVKKPAVQKAKAIQRRGMGRIAHAAKRYGKQTLRDLLLSKTFHAGFKLLVGIAIGGSALYGAYAFIGNSVAQEVVISESEILTRIKKHTPLPDEKPESVARVQDPEALRGQAGLYENIKVGDYIVIYKSVAVVYDLRNDRIIALKSRQQ